MNGKRENSNIRKSQAAKFLLENSNELLADLGVLIVGLKVVSLLGAGVSAHGADVDHAVTELDEGSSLDGDVQVGNVVQDEVGKLLVLVLTNPLDKAVGGERLAQLVCGQAVLGEAVVEEGGDRHASGLAELLLLLDEVGAADEANGALLAEGLEEVEDFGRGILERVGCYVSEVGFDQKTKNWQAEGGQMRIGDPIRSIGIIGMGQLTRRAGVNVPSTSKRQMVSFNGRSSRGV